MNYSVAVLCDRDRILDAMQKHDPDFEPYTAYEEEDYIVLGFIGTGLIEVQEKLYGITSMNSANVLGHALELHDYR